MSKPSIPRQRTKTKKPAKLTNVYSLDCYRFILTAPQGVVRRPTRNLRPWAVERCRMDTQQLGEHKREVLRERKREAGIPVKRTRAQIEADKSSAGEVQS